MKKSRHKMAVIIPYFGSWPEWFPYFLRTCMHNPSVDWYFPNDCPEPTVSGENLHFLPWSLNRFNEVASRKLDLEINVRFPYKICDMKPAYGEIFSELLEGYDFWGYGDLDLIYGNLQDFLTDEDLDRYDVFSNHPDFITGHFCLLRNTPEIRTLFKAGGAWRSVFSGQKYYGFDERLKRIRLHPDPRYLDLMQTLDRTGHKLHFRLHRFLKKVIQGPINPPSGNAADPQPADFTSIVRDAEIAGRIRVCYAKTFQSDLMLTKSGEKNWKAHWKDGELHGSSGEKISYFHFILSKKKRTFRVQPYDPHLSEFRICPGGITH
jgi:hypothetical protein